MNDLSWIENFEFQKYVAPFAINHDNQYLLISQRNSILLSMISVNAMLIRSILKLQNTILRI